MSGNAYRGHLKKPINDASTFYIECLYLWTANQNKNKKYVNKNHPHDKTEKKKKNAFRIFDEFSLPAYIQYCAAEVYII